MHILIMVSCMEIGSLVTRKSYNNDILFKIIDIKDEYILKGVYERIIADAKLEDLDNQVEFRNVKKDYIERIVKNNEKKKGYISGKILHLDGDEEYLEKCLELYHKVGVYVNGVHIKENQMSSQILSLIDQYNPDIIVITGHDAYNRQGLKDVSNYANSSNFINTIKKIRSRYSKDDKIIVAGACQSHFEALIASGANFATSPKRVNVHLFDPAIAAIKVSFTPFNKIVSINDIFKFSYIKNDGLGGVESYGKMRLLL